VAALFDLVLVTDEVEDEEEVEEEVEVEVEVEEETASVSSFLFLGAAPRPTMLLVGILCSGAGFGCGGLLSCFTTGRADAE